MHAWCAHRDSVLGYTPTQKQAGQILKKTDRTSEEDRILQDAWTLVLAKQKALARLWTVKMFKYNVSDTAETDYFEQALQIFLCLDGERKPNQWGRLFYLRLSTCAEVENRRKFREAQLSPMYEGFPQGPGNDTGAGDAKYPGAQVPQALAHLPQGQRPCGQEAAYELKRLVETLDTHVDGVDFFRHNVLGFEMSEIAEERGVSRQAVEQRFKRLRQTYAIHRHRTEPAQPASHGGLGKVSAKSKALPG